MQDKPERRAAERPAGAEAWSSVRRDAWRIEAFHAQIAWEERRKREAAGARRMVLIGLTLALLGVTSVLMRALV